MVPARDRGPPAPLAGGKRALQIRIAAALLFALALPLAGCGKKGPPNPPPGVPNTYPRSYPHE